MKKKDIIAWTIILSTGFGGLALLHQPHTESNHSGNSDKPMLITGFKAENAATSKTELVNARIVPRDDVIIETDLTGIRVLDVLADTGQTVSKGSILAVLDTGQLKNEYNRIASEYRKAEDTFKRMDKIKYTGAVSKDSVVQSEETYNALKAQLSEADRRLNAAKITASASGIIYARNIEKGALIQGAQQIFKIIKDNKKEIEAEVPENTASSLKPGMKATIIIGTDANKTEIPGTVRIVTPHITQSTRTALIRIMPEEELSAPIDSFAQARINTANITGLKIIQTAIQYDKDGSFVWVIENNLVKKAYVTVQLQEKSYSIINGLKEGQIVAAKAGAFLREGDKVELLNNKTGKE